jgi:hypothetical protein
VYCVPITCSLVQHVESKHIYTNLCDDTGKQD